MHYSLITLEKIKVSNPFCRLAEHLLLPCSVDFLILLLTTTFHMVKSVAFSPDGRYVIREKVI